MNERTIHCRAGGPPTIDSKSELEFARRGIARRSGVPLNGVPEADGAYVSKIPQVSKIPHRQQHFITSAIFRHVSKIPRRQQHFITSATSISPQQM
jgi:hypothetical protein